MMDGARQVPVSGAIPHPSSGAVRSRLIVAFDTPVSMAEVRKSTDSIFGLSHATSQATSLTMVAAAWTVYHGPVPYTSDGMAGTVAPWARRLQDIVGPSTGTMLERIAEESSRAPVPTAVFLVAGSCPMASMDIARSVKAAGVLARNEWVDSVTVLGASPELSVLIDDALGHIFAGKLRACGYHSRLLIEILEGLAG